MGENVTLMEQLPGAGTLAPQLLVSPKLAEALMPPITRAALPVLVRVTICAALVLPTA